MSAVNKGGTTLHSRLEMKQETKQIGLNDKSKAALGNRLSEVKLLTIDDLSLLSSGLWMVISDKYSMKH